MMTIPPFQALGDNFTDPSLSETYPRSFYDAINSYAMYNQHIRDGQVIRTGSVDFFDFAQSGGPAVQQQPFQVLPGDSFNIRCYYKNDEGTSRTFGLGSAEEMCMAFLLYYPRRIVTLSEDLSFGWFCGAGFASMGFSPCDAPFNVSVLDNGEVPAWRTFGLPTDECNATTGGTPDDTGATSSGGARDGRCGSWCIISAPLGVAVAVVMLFL